MQELRIVLTVLPVGPRGRSSLADGQERWFALQIAAGFAEPQDPEALDGLWPWVLHAVRDGRVELRGWRVDGAGTPDAPFDLVAEAPAPGAFGESLIKKMQEAYDSPEERQELDLRWLLPGEAGAEDPEHRRRSFPARVQYLATLPGEMARRLLATVYVRVPVAELFTRNAAGEWVPRARTLWIAPKAVGRPSPPREVALDGPPGPLTPGSALYKAGGLDDALPVAAIGPGFELQRLLDPDADAVFDLGSYWTPAGEGDSRFAEVEALLLAAFDPFAEIESLPADLVREAISFDTPRPLPAETADALLDLWRVQALMGELAAVTPKEAPALGVHRLAQLLLGPGKPVPSLAGVPVRWQAAAADLLQDADRLAEVLRLAGGTPRERLRQAAQRASFATVAAWLVQTFDAVLADSDPAAVRALAERWSFPGAREKAEVAERRLTLAQTVIGELREERTAVPFLDRLAGIGKGDAGSALRAAALDRLKQRWPAGGGRLGAAALGALAALGLRTDGEAPVLAAGAEERLAKAHLDRAWPDDEVKPQRPELPGRGLPIVVGPAAQRLLHERNLEVSGGSEVDANGLYGEIAGIALLVRRGRSREDLGAREWRLVTGGAALAGELGPRLFAPGQVEDGEWLRELLAVPLRPAFQQGVARSDVEYHGQPMLARSALNHAYAAEDYEPDDETAVPAGLPPAFTFQALGSFGTELPAEAAASRAPALRYGDRYELRAALVDQAGGLPVEIARDGEPWRLDPRKLAAPTPAPPEEAVIPYLRRVPVGEVNLLPSENQPGRRDWPALPGDVSLRVREWWGLGHPGADSLPVLLLSQGKRFPGTLAGYSFEVLPPALDEHTLLRWAAPAPDDPDAADKRTALRNALVGLWEGRQAAEAVRVHDPAVAALGVRVTRVGADNTVATVYTGVREPSAAGRPFEKQPLVLNVAAAPFGSAPDVPGDEGPVEIRLPEGTCASFEVWPLVPRAEFESRFASPDLFADLVDEDAPFPGHVAFRPAVVLAEAATEKLPAPVPLYDGLTLVEQNGAVAVRFDKPADHLAFVDRFTLVRERWVWRNRPLVTAEVLGDETDPDERRRLAASGLPREAFNPEERDRRTGPVADWERLAALDRGFVDRGELPGRWPRKVPADPSREAGGSAHGVLLALDDREAVTAADYLRYGLRVRSRYAGVLPGEGREATAADGTDNEVQTRRRIAVGFRGQAVKPPKILGLVPLTRPLASDPLAAPAGTTPFLVLLDETFFREYGIGERLDVRLTLENLDIGERPDAERPYRAGPLPDHWLRPQRLPDWQKPVTEDQDKTSPVRLDAFGPFGYSLDVSPAEALANASAFVIYPPAGVDPHWAMFARFRRVLDRPSAKQQSEPSDAHALYTLPDSSLLARAEAGEAGLERVSGTVFRCRGLRLLLDPLAKPGGAARAENSDAASQYRYFLLVSRILRGAGQALEVELPTGLWRARLFNPEGGFQKAGSFPVELGPGDQLAVEALGGIQPLEASGQYRGRILEVLLNGRYDELSRLDGDLHWHAFWKALLASPGDEAKERDAAGMIRRVSDAFDVLSG